MRVARDRAARNARVQRRLSHESAKRAAENVVGRFIGRSKHAEETRQMLQQLAAVDFSALVLRGETGIGKGLAARILHYNGPRAPGPLVEVNCAALPDELLGSELFGHEAGAFTGAKGRREGLFEQAHGGTFFLMRSVRCRSACRRSCSRRSRIVRFVESAATANLPLTCRSSPQPTASSGTRSPSTVSVVTSITA